MRLKERVALVTGGSGGIGSAICLGLANEGAHVAVHYFRNKGAAQRVAGEIEARGRRAFIYGADLTQQRDVEDLVGAVVECFGRIEILVNAAGSFLAKVLGPYNIYSNCVLPGTIATDLNRDFLSKPGVRESILEVTPLGRLGSPSDIVGAVTYLASGESNWTAGAAIMVDGGRSAEGR